SEQHSLLQALSSLHVQGQHVDWEKLVGDARNAGALELPTYAFQRARYWHDVKPLTNSDAVSVADGGELWSALRSGDESLVAKLLDVPDAEQQSLAPLLKTLADWDERRRSDARLVDLMYTPVWEPASQPTAASLAGAWLLVAAPEERASDIAAALAAVGAELERAERVAVERWGAARGVLIVADLSEASALTRTLAALSALREHAGDVPVWLVSRTATTAEQPVSTLAQRYASALARTVARNVSALDLPPTLDAISEVMLQRTLAAGPAARERVFGRDQAYVRRLSRFTPEARGRSHASGTVLITGDHGPLTLELVRWVSSRGAQHIVLASRLGCERALLEQVQSLGVRVSSVACELADCAALATLVAQLRAATPALRAIYHAPSQAAEPAWNEPDSAVHLAHYLAGSVAAARQLHELTQDLDLDHFVMFSPASTLFGASTQLGAAMARAGFDALAQERTRLGLRALSATIGDTVGSEPEHGTLAASLLLRGIELALLAGNDAMVIADFDWAKLTPLLEARGSDTLLSREHALKALMQSADGLDTRWLTEANEAERPRLVFERLKPWVQTALNIAEPTEQTNLFQSGIDSLLTLELMRWIRRMSGVTVAPRELILYPKLGALSAQVAKLATQPTVAAVSGIPVPQRRRLAVRKEQRLVFGAQEHCISTWGDPNASPIVCVHGYQDQGPIWEELAQRLVEHGHFVVAPDLRGHGLSAHSPGRKGTDLDGFVHDLDALCDALGPNKVTLVGHSLGTVLAVAMSASHREKVGAVCLVEPIVLPPEGFDLALALNSMQSSAAASDVRTFASREEALLVFEAFHPSMAEDLRHTLVDRLLTRSGSELHWRTDPRAIGPGRWMYRAEYFASLGKVTVPASVVVGESSPLGRRDEIAKAIPHGELVTLSGGHWIHYEQADSLAEAVHALHDRSSEPAR
ncbi:MAG TPA: alpha/beta fold hydrolase, partial [Polyangiales bacterium]|nr:alpha/beta fold hydrolase [Polyangiales bacterium]